MKDTKGRVYKGLDEIIDPIVKINNVSDVAYDEVVEMKLRDGATRLGRVMKVSRQSALIQVFEGTSGMTMKDTYVKFLGKSFTINVSTDMLGRIFDGQARPIDGGPPVTSGEVRDIGGLPINPSSREYPDDFIQTGITAIDVMNTLTRGQKLPIFTGSGLPHNKLAAQITKQVRITDEDSPFAIVFVGMGLKHDEAFYFKESFRQSGALNNVVMFLNLAGDPAIEAVITPRAALTLAEYLAFEKDMHVLVIMTDMINYCNALREVASSRGDLPARKGYPSYLYSDLAEIYERTGRVSGCKGSITQIPILSMPNDDITHPVPDLSGYITEGQIVLDRRLSQVGVYPPIAVLPSLSRLMKDGIGKGKTRVDHAHLSSQLYASYAKVQEIRSLASIIGEDELSEIDRDYLEFGEALETRFLQQGEDEDRTIIESLDLGWNILSILPPSELTRVTQDEIQKHHHFVKK
ncbi:MAG: V-type ATP synthase subunit B [Candidatus Ancaeobacter aquaticus]|nr:V-type ATP synthase subunit B [Candidatus Ancaeobacter aquaticus]